MAALSIVPATIAASIATLILLDCFIRQTPLLKLKPTQEAEGRFPHLTDTIPLLGNLGLLLTPTSRVQIRKIGCVWRYLPAFLFKDKMLLVLRPDFIQTVLKAGVAEPLMPARWSRIFGAGSLPVVRGVEHARLRGATAVAFSEDSIEEVIPRLREIARECLAKMVAYPEAGQGRLYPAEALHEFAFKAFCSFIVGTDERQICALTRLQTDLKNIMKGLGDVFLPEWIPFSGFNKALAARDRASNALRDIVEERRLVLADTEERKDALSALILEGTLATTEIVDVILSWMTGVDKTAKLTSTCLYTMIYKFSPEFADMVKTVANTASLSPHDLANLPIFEAFIKETQRCYSTIPGAFRTLAVDTSFDGVLVKAGTPLDLSYGFATYHIDGLSFEADRFMGKAALDVVAPETFIPFGAGERMCPGGRLARMIVKCFLYELLRDYDVKAGVGKVKSVSFPMIYVDPCIALKRMEIIK
ncbi:cytochrome P450 [Chytriomyces sp. MP71]|nr:cytochrome P450 [Chytriomyces sp. MP71]